jgi:hydroxypyruvate reductase
VDAGVDAARPERVVADRLRVDDDGLVVTDAAGVAHRYDLAAHDRVLVVGGGKAAAGLVRGLHDLLGDRIDEGAVVVPADDAATVGPVRLLPGDHPTPSERGADSTREVLSLAASATADDLVLAVVTGGGSALLAAPAEGVSLPDLAATTDALLAAGADIAELNAVRKHCSAVKGGGLARAAAPATVAGLVVSDVVGDDLGVVASGPTAPDATTYDDALAVLDRYDRAVPDGVRDHLARGAAGEVAETARADDPAFDRCRTHVLANGRTALRAAAERAQVEGVEATTLTAFLDGEARETGRTLAAVAREVATGEGPATPPAVLLAGGETTVTVAGDGTGGPNQELALAAALSFGAWAGGTGATGTAKREGDGDGRDGPLPVALAAVDTDGLDGSTDAAGALVDATTVGGDREAAREALAANDALPFLDARTALVETGPTGTNVNDLVVVVVGEARGGRR